ncbi:hypothetical protein ABPG72_003472 [Tetrahymena utriculariae]
MRQFSKFLQNLEKEQYKKKYAVSEVRLVGLPDDHYPNTIKTVVYVLGIIGLALGLQIVAFVLLQKLYNEQTDSYYKIWLCVLFIGIGIFIVVHYFAVKTEVKEEQINYRDHILQQRQIFIKNAIFYQKQEKLFSKKPDSAQEKKQQKNTFDDFLRAKKQEIQLNKQGQQVNPSKKKKKKKLKTKKNKELTEQTETNQ